MKLEYDTERDLLYVWLGPEGRKAARTVCVSPGVHADFAADDTLIGLEVLDASELLGDSVRFEVKLPHTTPRGAA